VGITAAGFRTVSNCEAEEGGSEDTVPETGCVGLEEVRTIGVSDETLISSCGADLLPLDSGDGRRDIIECFRLRDCLDDVADVVGCWVSDVSSSNSMSGNGTEDGSTAKPPSA